MREAAVWKCLQALALLGASSSGTVLPRLLVARAHARARASSSAKRSAEDDAAAASKADEGAIHADGQALDSPETENHRLGELVSVGLSLGNAFAGGIMLATGMAHILGDAIKESLRVSHADLSHMPSVEAAIYAPVVYCLVGILVPFFLEKSGLLFWLVRSGTCFTSHYIFLHQLGILSGPSGDEEDEEEADEAGDEAEAGRRDRGAEEDLESSTQLWAVPDERTPLKHHDHGSGGGKTTCGETPAPRSPRSLDTRPPLHGQAKGSLAGYGALPGLSKQTSFDGHAHNHGFGHAPPIPLSVLERSRSCGHYGRRDPRLHAPPLAVVALPRGDDSVGSQESCRSKCVVPGFTSLRLQGRLDVFKAMKSMPGQTLEYAPLIYAPDDLSIFDGSELDARVPPRSLIFKLRKRSSADAQLLRAGDDFDPLAEKPGAGDSFAMRHPSTVIESGAAPKSQQQEAEGCDAQEDDQTVLHEHPEKHSHMFFATFLMFLVLSVHSLIVGLTIGSISMSELRSQQNAFIAVLIHKLFESLALGVSAAQHPVTPAVVAELVAYNLAAPAGILVGMMAESYSILDDGSEVVMLGVASGSFIYIALVEVLAEEFEDEEYRILKFACFLAGTTVMTYLARVA